MKQCFICFNANFKNFFSKRPEYKAGKAILDFFLSGKEKEKSQNSRWHCLSFILIFICDWGLGIRLMNSYRKQLQPPLSLIITGGQWKGTKFRWISGRMPPKKTCRNMENRQGRKELGSCVFFSLFREGEYIWSLLLAPTSVDLGPDSGYRATQREARVHSRTAWSCPPPCMITLFVTASGVLVSLLVSLRLCSQFTAGLSKHSSQYKWCPLCP